MDESAGEAYPVVIPRLGLTMVEASVLQWYRQDGEWVEKGEPLFAIENEKAAVDIEAPASGYLVIQAPLGVTLPVLTRIAEIRPSPPPAKARQNASQLPAVDQPQQKPSSPQPSPIVSEQPAADRPPASPKARGLAKQLGVSLSEVSGSGMRGMITSADVQRQAEKLARRASPLAERIAHEAGIDLSAVHGSGHRGRILRRDVEALLSQPTPPTPSAEPLGGLRATIARRLTSSWQERPQVTLFCEADAVSLLELREKLNEELAEKRGKVSLNALLIKICASALSEHRLLNAYLEGDRIVHPSEINIAIAVDTERGLVAPVIRQADQKPLSQIQRELNEAIQRALQNRSAPQDLEDGTFTLTNLGMYEVDGFTPLLNPPQSAILGVGRIRPKPAEADDGRLVMRPQVTLSLSFDHRLIDGAPAARFLQRLKHFIERPYLLLW